MRRLCDRVVVVWAPESERIERLIRRKGFTRAQARARLRAQWPLARKVRLADAVIDNSGSLARARAQARALMKRWRAELSSREAKR